MNDMKKKEKLMGIIMAVSLSAIMGLIFVFVKRHNAEPQALEKMPPVVVDCLISMLESITVGVIIALVIPIGKLGRALSAKFGAKPPSVKFSLLNSIPFALINAIVCSAVCSFIGIATSYGKNMNPNKPPLIKMWFSQWINTLWISILVGYVLALLISPLVLRAVGLGKPPAGRPPVGGPPNGRPPMDGPPVGGPPMGKPPVD